MDHNANYGSELTNGIGYLYAALIAKDDQTKLELIDYSHGSIS